MNEEVRKRIARCVDGAANEGDWETLAEELRRDDGALAAYCDEIELCAGLEWIEGSESDLATTVRRQSRLVEEFRRGEQRRARVTGLGVAAAAMVCMLIYGSFRLIDAVPRGSLRPNELAEWTIHREGGGTDRELRLKQGDRLDLADGAIELTLAGDVRAVMEAPASLTLVGRQRVALDEGRAYFEMLDENAVGFTVETPRLKVVDLGTRFGIEQRAGRAAEVHLFEGRVQVSPKVGRVRATVDLTAGQGVVEIVGIPGRLRPLEANPGRFARELPVGYDEVHLSFDSADGEDLKVNGRQDSLAARVIAPEGGSGFELVPGRFGMAARFAGDGTHVRVEGWSGIKDDEPRTVAFWCRFPVSQRQGRAVSLVNWGSGGERERDGRWGVSLERGQMGPAGVLRTGPGFDRGVLAGSDLRDGRWHHVASVFDPSISESLDEATRIYIDGELMPHTTTGNGRISTDPSDRLLIGRAVVEGLSHLDSIEGELDELRVIRTALGPRQIQRLIETNQLSPR